MGSLQRIAGTWSNRTLAPRVAAGGFGIRFGMASADEELRRMAELEALAEKAYDEMYETRYPTGLYSDLKEFFALAIGAAERAGRPDEVERLTQRLDHCREVYRKHFSGF